MDTAVKVGRAAAEAPEVELAGVAGFEGVIGGQRIPEIVEPVRQFLSTIRQTAEELMAAGAFRSGHPVILSAGGSAFFDHVVDVFTTDRHRYPQPVDVVIRSGCYLTHDHATYREASPFRDTADADFQPAIEVCPGSPSWISARSSTLERQRTSPSPAAFLSAYPRRRRDRDRRSRPPAKELKWA